MGVIAERAGVDERADRADWRMRNPLARPAHQLASEPKQRSGATGSGGIPLRETIEYAGHDESSERE